MGLLDLNTITRRRIAALEGKKALKSLEEGTVTYLKAAEMAGVSAWDFADIVREKGAVWISSRKNILSDIEKTLE